jgi:hypothetical protein
MSRILMTVMMISVMMKITRISMTKMTNHE